MIIHKTNYLKGELSVPGDKSISHRSIMLGSIADGITEVTNFLQGADCLSSISCFSKMGIQIENNKDSVIIHGKGLHGLSEPKSILDVGNSGTTTRLMSGILAAQHFNSSITGDASMQKRPMSRIINPLSQMGATITSRYDNNCVPLDLTGGNLQGIDYISPVASAQVKSAILLAGLYADGSTSVTEPYVSRNHTELMFKSYGVDIETIDQTVTIKPASKLVGQHISVPGDISSATYFIVAGLITPNSEITIKNVGINKTRDGIIRVCKDMGGHILLSNILESSGETVADITVSSSSLEGITIEGSIIPTLIDEIPAIAVLACFADGTTVIKDAGELKVKESNRIDTVVNNLQKMGAYIESTEDGMIIHGGYELHGATIDSDLDHRIAMSFAIAGLNANGDTDILGSECVDISYPSFYHDLQALNN